MKPSTPTKRTGGNGTTGQLAKKSKTKDNNNLAVDGLDVPDSIGLLGNVFIVQRLEDGKRLVAKVSRNPEEEEILAFLHTRESQSEHIIPLVGAFPSNMGRGILLPLQQSVLSLLRHPGVHRSRFLQFAEDLVKGVSFLHRHCVTHRDIKPDNLVYTDKFQLQIIDFDSAVQLADPDQLLDEDVGTEGYKSPDTQDSYGRPRLRSPIRADSWSCGLVISRFLSCSDKDAHLHQNLEQFARRLMDEDPWSRPSLCEWFKPPNKKRDDVEVEDKVDAPRKR
jgi:serine/threonine protein kinase